MAILDAAGQEWVPCSACDGEEGRHVNGEWVDCGFCEGQGGWWRKPVDPTEQQSPPPSEGKP